MTMHTLARTPRLMLAATLLVALPSIITRLATAQAPTAQAPPPQPQRTILERHDQSEVPGKEVILGTATLPQDTAIGWHVHSGDESGYVLKGTLTLKTRGQPDRSLKTGDSFFNARGAVHSLVATPGGDGGTAVSTWIVDKDKPLATPVP